MLICVSNKNSWPVFLTLKIFYILNMLVYCMQTHFFTVLLKGQTVEEKSEKLIDQETENYFIGRKEAHVNIFCPFNTCCSWRLCVPSLFLITNIYILCFVSVSKLSICHVEISLKILFCASSRDTLCIVCRMSQTLCRHMNQSAEQSWPQK